MRSQAIKKIYDHTFYGRKIYDRTFFSEMDCLLVCLVRLVPDQMLNDYDDELKEAKVTDDLDTTELHKSWGVTDKQSRFDWVFVCLNDAGADDPEPQDEFPADIAPTEPMAREFKLKLLKLGLVVHGFPATTKRRYFIQVAAGEDVLLFYAEEMGLPMRKPDSSLSLSLSLSSLLSFSLCHDLPRSLSDAHTRWRSQALRRPRQSLRRTFSIYERSPSRSEIKTTRKK